MTFAENTKKTYSTHLRKYLEFCAFMSLSPVPISQQNLACYIAHLSEQLKFKSVKQYLNGVRLLHEEAGFPSPLSSYYIKSVMKGVNRFLGEEVSSKLPITVEILLSIFDKLDFSSSFDVCFWAICLVAFFSFLRKSNLMCSAGSFNPDKDLCRGDVSFL